MRHLLNMFGILFGVVALLLCVNVPAQARPAIAGGHSAHGVMPDDMHCCPDAPSTPMKACAQHCPLVVAPGFAFHHITAEKSVEFHMTSATRLGVTYAPLAPPPR